MSSTLPEPFMSVHRRILLGETTQFSPERIEVTGGTLDLRTLVANRRYRFDSDNVVPGVSLKSAVACTRVLSEIPFH